ncbi:MAG: OmpH family outer membrane protein [bacterium]
MSRIGLAGPVMALLLGFSSAHAADLKIGFIDLNRTFEDYYKTKLADGQLKEQADEFKVERQKILAEYKAAQQAFEDARDAAQNTALNEDVRDRRRSEADEKLSEVKEMESKIRRFDDSRQKQLDEQSRRMRKKLVGEIQGELTKYAQAEGYTAVLDHSGDTMNGVPTVFYYDATQDITDAFLAILNKGQIVPSAGKSAASKAPAAK